MLIPINQSTDDAKTKIILEYINDFLTELKTEVMDKRWEGTGVRTYSGLPSGIRDLRILLTTQEAQASNPIELFEKVYELLSTKVTLNSAISPDLNLPIKTAIERVLSYSRSSLYLLNYQGAGERKEETQNFYNEQNTAALTLITRANFYLPTPNAYLNSKKNKLEGVQINKDYLIVCKKNDAPIIVRPERMHYFLTEQQHLLDDQIISQINLNYGSRIHYYTHNPLKKLSSDDCLKLYADIFELISRYKKKSKKPLMVLIGEYHDTAYSLLIEMITLSILRHFGLENLLIEQPDDVVSIQNDMLDTSGGIDFLMFLAATYKLTIVPIDLEQRARQLQSESSDVLETNLSNILSLETLLKTPGLSVENLASAQEAYTFLSTQITQLDAIGESIMDLRDEGMYAKMNELLKGATPLIAPDPKIKMAIVGANHLAGLSKKLNPQAEHEVLTIVCTRSYPPPHYSQENFRPFFHKRSLFYQTDPHVEKIVMNKDCAYHTNRELLAIVVDAEIVFMDIQKRLLIDDMADLKKFLNQYENNHTDGSQLALYEQLKQGLTDIGSRNFTSALLKRYDLRQLLHSVLNEIPSKDHPLNNFYTDLSTLYEKMNTSAFQITHLNEEEHTFCHKFK